MIPSGMQFSGTKCHRILKNIQLRAAFAVPTQLFNITALLLPLPFITATVAELLPE